MLGEVPFSTLGQLLNLEGQLLIKRILDKFLKRTFDSAFGISVSFFGVYFGLCPVLSERACNSFF